MADTLCFPLTKFTKSKPKYLREVRTNARASKELNNAPSKYLISSIFLTGPVAAGVNAEPLVDYKGGVVKDNNILHKLVNHVVSIVGWGNDGETEYWIVRNSWGQYW